MSNDKPFHYLVADWLAAYRDFFAALEALPPDRREAGGLCGAWSARQVVAHLAGWQYECFRRYIEIAAGDFRDKPYDVDAFNALQVEARAHLSWEQTVGDLREAIDILRNQAYDVPEHIAAVEPRYGEWMRGLARDAREHYQQLVVWATPASV